MSVLKVRDDTTGNWVIIPGIPGQEGKSAYQQAVDGGYTGTEEEFTTALADATSEAWVRAQGYSTFSGKYSDLTNKPVIDNTPQADSNNLISSGAVYRAIVTALNTPI